eukprot:3412148-Lingulodinium_polyedra.AAC.1
MASRARRPARATPIASPPSRTVCSTLCPPQTLLNNPTGGADRKDDKRDENTPAFARGRAGPLGAHEFRR